MDGSIEIGPPDTGFGGPQPTIVFEPSSEPKAGKLRLHIDVSPTDRDQDAELTRLLGAGPRTSASAATKDGTCCLIRRQRVLPSAHPPPPRVLLNRHGINFLFEKFPPVAESACR